MSKNEVNTPTEEDFITTYMRYTTQTECPFWFNRWTAISCLAAHIGRRVHFKHGHFTIYPNMYIMLIGLAGTKKSSAIKIGSKLIAQSGYKFFAAKKTRQEKYLLDLAESAEELYENSSEGEQYALDSIIDENLFGTKKNDESAKYVGRPPAESFITADEFNNFLGVNNLDFASILGDLWDFEGIYDYRLKNSKSIYIPDPTVNMLGGNTQTNLSLCFPTEVIGQGFFSRLLLIYGEPSGRKFTIPPLPDLDIQSKLLSKLASIKENVHGEMKMSDDAFTLLDYIYHNYEGVDDARFDSYKNRRLTHLIKLCMVIAIARESIVISFEDIVKANTYLTAAEQLMPKALGEFGKAKHSGVTHKVLSRIETAMEPVLFKDLWKVVHQDLDTRQQLVEILGNLQLAGKIQSVNDHGWLPNKEVKKTDTSGTVDYSYLTREELNLL